MLAKLRAWFARKPQKTAPQPAPVAAPRSLVNWRSLLGQLRGAPVTTGVEPPQRKFDWPVLPDGVLPASEAALSTESPGMAMDGQTPLPAPTVLAAGEVQRTSLAMDGGFTPNPFGFINGGGYGTGLWFPGYPYLAELTQISEYRAPCETIATEMCRKWFELQSKNGGDKSDKIAQIMARCDELKVRDLFRRAALLDAEFGRAQIYMNINDADDRVRQLPLEVSPEGIPKGSLKSISCIEPYWSTPYSWNAAYPERADFYKPVSWYIMGRKTHASRLLTFIGREVPDLLKPAYNFSGISMIQLGEMSVNMWLRTRKAVNDLVNNFSIPVLHTDLAATLEDGAPDGSGLVARLQAFTLTRNNQGVTAINKDSELLEFAEASLASLDKLQAQSQEHMAACWHTPLIKLFGVVPTGLNATGEGEIQVWYDWINAQQVALFEPHLYQLLKAIQCDLFGEIDDDLVIHWVTLDEPTQKELSEIRKSDAEMDASNINAGIISPDEARARLQADPDSGYSNLTGPPPEPEEPEVPEEPTTDPDSDAQREHEAAENQKDREHELAKTKLTAQAKNAPAVPIRARTKD